MSIISKFISLLSYVDENFKITSQKEGFIKDIGVKLDAK